MKWEVKETNGQAVGTSCLQSGFCGSVAWLWSPHLNLMVKLSTRCGNVHSWRETGDEVVRND